MEAGKAVIVVISDLHIGAGPLDDFDVAIELEFVSFIAALGERTDSIELVINGDFLEFVQAEPWDDVALRAVSKDGHGLCFTEDQSVTKLRSIVRHHPNVFGALGRFLARDNREIVILPGNHDADFFWTKVRDELVAVLTKAAGRAIADQLRFVLAQVYRPPKAPSVWIEHGHQHDQCNNFIIGGQPYWSEQYPPILETASGGRRLIECVGTRFLMKFINRLDASYPFVDNVKPFSKFIRMFGVSALRFDYGAVPAAVAVWNMIKWFASTVRRSPRDFLTVPDGTEPSIAAAVSAAWTRAPDEQQKDIIAALQGRGINLSSPLPFLLENPASAERVLDALADNLDIAAKFPEFDPRKMSAPGTGKMTLVPGFFADESADLIVASRAALTHSGATVVVMGHTHEPQDHPDGLSYVNTGSWTRYLRTNASNDPSSWSLLRRNAVANFPYRLLYAQIDVARPEAVELNEWRPSNAV
jgi:UDP-2,3-diacylglucosamine pyrophosphatase LpxH